MYPFETDLKKKILQSASNNFGIENYDEYRFGKFLLNSNRLLERVKSVIKQIIYYERNLYNSLINQYGTNLQYVWENLDNECKTLFTDILAFRILSYRKVKLPLNRPEYWNSLNKVKALKNPLDTYDSHFLHFHLEKFDLNPLGFDIKLYFSDIGIVIDFFLEQYTYKSGNRAIVAVEKDDVVIDLGACWGDTALYFAHKAGTNGKVYSFEFIPDNIKLFNTNISLNPRLKERIELIQNPASNSSGDNIYFFDNGPASKIKFEPFKEQTGYTTTISIDDFVKNNNINKIDFIKMDIEGAESIALEGAIETIKRLKPKLAIAIYHSMKDFANIPKWILGLDLDYEIFIGHYTINSEETICFAKPRLN